MNDTRVALIGIGGFGNQYVNALLREPKREGVYIAAACDPRPEGCQLLNELKQRGVPLFDTPEELFQSARADLAVIATPIAFHRAHAALAFRNGCHVLLEKPIAATEEEGLEILRARDAADRLLAVGFQWCYDAAMRAFKRDAIAGRYGKLRSMKAIVLWPRDRKYYARGGGWAGKRFAADGSPIFDSVASNATAHYIMNMLWLAGASEPEAANLALSAGKTLRVNDIETFDTVVFEGNIGSARAFYTASHAIGPEDAVNPAFEYRFERAVARFSEDEGGDIRVRLDDGGEVVYPKSVPSGANVEKLWLMIDAIRSGNAASLPCPGEAALSHARAMALINAIEPDDMRNFREIDPARDACVLPGLGAKLREAYALARVPENWR